MTVDQMHRGVKLGLDKTSSLALPAFEPEEIDLWLNIAQDKFIETCFDLIEAANVNSDTLSKYTGYIAHLYRYPKSLNTPNNFADLAPNVYTAYEAAWTMKQYSKVTKVVVDITNRQLEDGTIIISTTIPAEYVPFEKLNKYFETTFNYPYFENPVWSYAGTSTASNQPLIVVCIDSYTESVSNIKIGYYEQPVAISLSAATDCQMPIDAHQKIVDMAVTLMIENIESPRIQTQPQTIKL